MSCYRDDEMLKEAKRRFIYFKRSTRGNVIGPRGERRGVRGRLLNSEHFSGAFFVFRAPLDFSVFYFNFFFCVNTGGRGRGL